MAFLSPGNSARSDVDVARLSGLQAAHDELLPVDLHGHRREPGVAVVDGHDVLGRRDVDDIDLRETERVHDHRVTVGHVAGDVGHLQRQLGRQALIDLRARHDDRRSRPDREGRDRDRGVDRLGHDDRLDAARRIRGRDLDLVGGPGIVCVNAHAGGVLSRRITLFTVRTNEPPTELMTTDAGVYVGADHANPAIGASAASVIVHVLPVGMPVTVAGLLGETDPAAGVARTAVVVHRVRRRNRSAVGVRQRLLDRQRSSVTGDRVLTVITNVPLVELITIDDGLYVGAAQVKPPMAAGATSVTVHVLLVGMPVTVAGMLVVTVLLPV